MQIYPLCLSVIRQPVEHLLLCQCVVDLLYGFLGGYVRIVGNILVPDVTNGIPCRGIGRGNSRVVCNCSLHQRDRIDRGFLRKRYITLFRNTVSVLCVPDNNIIVTVQCHPLLPFGIRDTEVVRQYLVVVH